MALICNHSYLGGGGWEREMGRIEVQGEARIEFEKFHLNQ
jgi:hypothetical protein